MYWESSFYTNVERYFSNCESFLYSSTLSLKNNTFEYLYSFSLTFNYFNVNSYCVPRSKVRNFFL